MPAYLIGTVRVTKPEQFARYAQAVDGLAASFGGERILAGPVKDVLEGGSPIGERVVVTRFADEAQARAYLSSQRYREARALRDGAADVELRLV